MKKTFTSGNTAIAEGAITAGLKFYAGYPITPSSEIMEYLSEKLPEHGGIVIQMEDEIASILAIIGASWTGLKSMTATSGPGLSLMAEGIGYAVITETPIVVVDVMRTGPATGVPTKTSQSDIFQARWLAHGDYIIPSYIPWSVQEAYSLTIKAFNTAEMLRTPVILLSDAIIAHLWEPVTMRDPGEVEIVNRKIPSSKPVIPYKPGEDLVPPMPIFGKGFKGIAEGLIHDEYGGFAPTNEVYRALIKRFYLKILKRLDQIYEQEEYYVEDADTILISYGSTARSVYVAIRELMKKNIKVGLIRLKTLWPLHEEKLRETCKKAKKIIVVENNMGKLVMDMERIFKDKEVYFSPVLSIELPTPREVLEAVEPWL